MRFGQAAAARAWPRKARSCFLELGWNDISIVFQKRCVVGLTMKCFPVPGLGILRSGSNMAVKSGWSGRMPLSRRLRRLGEPAMPPARLCRRKRPAPQSA